jgi:outer membrane biosynthesis protein TonB
MPTQSSASLVRIGSALMLILILAACTPGGQFDPTEVVSMDLFNTKKKIQGDREPLFPNGVPGAETGVPPDLVKGYQPPPEPPTASNDTAAKPVAEAKPKPNPKPKPKVARAPAAPAHDPAFDQQPASAPAQTQQPWPSSPPAAAAQTAWPAPPPANGQAQQPAPSAQTSWPAPPNGQAQTNWPDPSTLGKPH